MRFILFLVLLTFILGNSSCEDNDSEKKWKPCPDFLICEDAGASVHELHLIGFIEEDKFTRHSVKYCSFHYYPTEGRPEKQEDIVEDLKVKVYSWDGSISYEISVYLLNEKTINKKQVVIYLSSYLRPGQVLKIIKLNAEGEELKVLGEMKEGEIPRRTAPYDCEYPPFIFNQNQEKITKEN